MLAKPRAGQDSCRRSSHGFVQTIQERELEIAIISLNSHFALHNFLTSSPSFKNGDSLPVEQC
jgi:hypothetical protein